MALLDPDTSFSSDIVRDLRAAIDSSTIPADIIWAVAGTNADRAEELVGQTRPGEHLLLNARSLARDCGASSLPVVIIAAPSGGGEKCVARLQLRPLYSCFTVNSPPVSGLCFS